MPWTSEFVIQEKPRTIAVRDSSGGKDTVKAVNRAFAKLIDRATQSGKFHMLNPSFREDYRIIGYSGVRLRRSAAALFGIASRGAHMTAYVREQDEFKIWVSRRNKHLFTYPGMLDTTVAGGVKAEQSPLECIIQEAEEEASLPKDYVSKCVQAAGTITYVSQRGKKDWNTPGLLAPDFIYVYDIELPRDLSPKPNDDEVEGFYLWDLKQIKTALLNEEFKPNCASVMIDFFIRRGIISAENEPDYIEICTRLHRPLPVPTTSLLMSNAVVPTDPQTGPESPGQPESPESPGLSESTNLSWITGLSESAGQQESAGLENNSGMSEFARQFLK